MNITIWFIQVDIYILLPFVTYVELKFWNEDTALINAYNFYNI